MSIVNSMLCDKWEGDEEGKRGQATKVKVARGRDTGETSTKINK